MSKSNIIPIILSGGSGTRLWPLSRGSKPKQFLGFGGGHTLIEDTVLRCQGKAFDKRPIFVAAEAHRFMVAEAAQALGISSDILLEPMRRDSCAAIVAGALQAQARDPDATVLVVAADHHIPDANAFAKAVQQAATVVDAGWLVTFGVRPRSPATGYGYILPGVAVADGDVAKVNRFVEKPDLATAKTYLAAGYLWNSGNFLFKASAFLAEAEKFVPEVVAAMRQALQAAIRDLDFSRLETKSFASSPQISVDFAIMEKTSKAAVLPVDYAWNDIGSWDAVATSIKPDDNGNVIVGKGFVEAAHNVMVHSEERLTTVLGCDDIVVVATRDAVMVVKKGMTERVKDLVADLKTAGHIEAEQSIRQYRPWGHHEVLDAGEGYQVRRIMVAPGQQISRQSHANRAEHWIVVKGMATATINDMTVHLFENQSLTIPQGAVHQIGNNGKEASLLIEVQSGKTIDERDVTRL